MILQTAVRMAEQHKNLPPEDAERFAFVFKELNEKLANRQIEKLKSRDEFPAKFPEPQLPAKLTYIPSRKRALTGREAADQQEADDARARRKAERLAAHQAVADAAMDKETEARTQLQEDAAAAYLTLKALEDSRPSSEDEYAEFVDIDDIIPESSTALKALSKHQVRQVLEGKAQKVWGELKAQMAIPRLIADQVSSQPNYDHPSQPKSEIQPLIEISDDNDKQEEELRPEFILDNAIESESDKASSDDDDDLPELGQIFSQQAFPAKRVRKLTTKQLSQERHAEEKRLKKEARLKKKLKTTETSQLHDLPVRSS
jgi:hypothetical protein